MIVAYADAKYCEGCGGFDVVPCDGTIASVASGSVMVGSGSATEHKRSAFAFNPACLTAIRGCNTIADLAPALWQGTPAGTLQCTGTEQQ
jgi:hypothetical protein